MPRGIGPNVYRVSCQARDSLVSALANDGYWAPYPDDLASRVQTANIPAPGDEASLLAVCAELCAAATPTRPSRVDCSTRPRECWYGSPSPRQILRNGYARCR